jgi:8-oxo-dGTP pyrophosphatase MutT (NUDIX family)
MSREVRGRTRRLVDAGTRSAMRLGFPLLKLWWRIAHPTLEGVYVAVRHRGEVLVIRNSYRNAYSFPSGRRGRREEPVLAAVRELREEVGIAVGPEQLRHVAEVLHATRLVDDHVHVFELELEAPPALRIDHREVVWAAFEAPEQARQRRLLPIVRGYLEGTLSRLASPAPSRTRRS